MENPNIYSDFKSFKLLGKNGIYNVNIRYKNPKELHKQRLIENIDVYKVYTTTEPTYFYIYSESEDFIGLASLELK